MTLGGANVTTGTGLTAGPTLPPAMTTPIAITSGVTAGQVGDDRVLYGRTATATSNVAILTAALGLLRVSIPVRTRRAVHARARGKCESCGEKARLDLHHLRRWTEPGPDGERLPIAGRETRDDLRALCRRP